MKLAEQTRNSVLSGKPLEVTKTQSVSKGRAPLHVTKTEVKTGGVSGSAGARAMQEQRMEQSQPVVQPVQRAQPPATTVPSFMQAQQQPTDIASAIRNFQTSHPVQESQNQQLANKLKQVPVVGSVIRGLDWLSNKTEPAAKIAQEYYTPGAGASAIGAFEKGIGSAVAKFAPNVGKVGTNLIKGAATGAVTGAAQPLAAHPEEGLKGAAIGGLEGLGAGIAAPLAGKAIAKAASPAIKKISTMAEVLINNNPVYKQMVSQIGEDTTRANIGKQNIADLDEQIANASNGSAPDREAQLTSLLGDRQAAVDYVKQYEPEYQPELPRVRAGKQTATALPEIPQAPTTGPAPQAPTFTPGEPVGVPQAPQTPQPAVPQGKAAAMKSAAASRKAAQGDSLFEVPGGLTPKELEAERARRSTNYVGKKVSVDGQEGEITGSSFGKVGVKLADGTTRYVEPGAITPKEDVAAIIKAGKPAEAPKQPNLRAPLQRQQGIRSNFVTQQESEGLTNELKYTISRLDHEYEPITNIDTVNAADDAIQAAGVPTATMNFLNRTSTDAQHIAEGYRLMQLHDAQGDYETAATVAAKVAADLTNAGQKVQAARIIKRLSPEGKLIRLTQKAEANGKVVTPEDTKAFTEAAREAQADISTGVRSNAIDDVLDKLKAGLPPTEEDLNVLQSMADQAQKGVKEKPVTQRAVKNATGAKKTELIATYLQSIEDSALARIKARKNQLNALPLGEWRDHALVLAAQIAKTGVKAADHVDTVVQMFGEGARDYATQLYDMANSIVKQAYPKIKAGELTEANAIIKKLTQTKSADPEKMVGTFAVDNKLTVEETKKLAAFAKKAKELSGMDAENADLEMQKIMNKYNKSSALDKITAIRFMEMLGNTATQLLNIGSGAIQAGVEFPMNLLGMMIETFVPGNRTIGGVGTRPDLFISDLFKGLKKGAKYGYHGSTPKGLSTASEARGLAFQNVPVMRQLEGGLNAIMTGADYAFYNATYSAELRKQASLAAKRNKLTGDAAGKFIKQFVKNPTPEAELLADNVAKDVTFQRADKLGGQTAQWIGGAPKGIRGAARVVLPFIKTPLNIAQQAAEATPYGLVRGIWDIAKSGDDPAKQRDAVRTLSRGIGGGALSWIGFELSKAGVITGANQSGDKDVDAVREQAGQGKYRFNQSGALRYLKALFDGEGIEAARKQGNYQEGDRQFDYNRIQPFATPLAVGATFNESKSEGGVGNQATAAVGEGLQSLLGMSSVQTLQNLLGAAPGQTMKEKALNLPKNILESYLKSFSPSLLAQEARRQDTTLRKTAYNKSIGQDVGQYFQSRNPYGFGLGVPTSEELPPSMTTLGAPKQQAKGAAAQYANPFRTEITQYNKAAGIIADLIGKTGDTTIAPSAPQTKVTGKDLKTKVSRTVEIPAARYKQLQEDIGQEVTSKILNLDSSLSDDQKVDKIKDILDKTKKKYTDRVKHELGLRF